MIKDILVEDVIATDVEVSDWYAAVKACGDLLVKANRVKPEYISTMIAVVEEFGPYMILVPEVIFFHGRPGALVNSLGLSLITLKKPIFFREFAYQKISCAFGFGAVDAKSHLDLLADLSSLLQDKKFIELITHNGKKEDIMELINKY